VTPTVVQRSIARPRPVRRSSRALAGYLDARLHLAALSLVAGAIHAVAAVPHLDEYRVSGVLFSVLALFQIGWGIGVYRRPSPPLLLAGIAVSCAVIAVWALSRTVGLPLGPEAGSAEAVGPLDAIATAIECTIGGMCLAFLRPERSLPAPVAIIRPIAVTLMIAGLGALLLGAGHHA
jgi:hypothetical protein